MSDLAGRGCSIDDRRRAAAHVMLDQPEALQADVIVVSPDAQHHLRRVLRLSDGERVTVADGQGGWRSTEVVLTRSELHLRTVGAICVEEAGSPVTIISAIPKGDRLDWMVQKVTELGVDRLVLVDAERSVVRWPEDRVERNMERLRRIADEACAQSRRVWDIEVDGPFDAREVLAGAVLAEPGGRRLGVTDRVIAVGPEGGWSPEELALAADRVSLGATVLRIETAAVAVAALCVVDRH